MPTVNDILTFIETLAPTYMKEDWDNVGLNCGHTHREVKKILVALDPFETVCKEAKTIGADLLITHHALIWTPGFVTDNDTQGKNTMYLIENGIACINAHTNLDCAPNGVNDILANKLDLANISVIEPKGEDANGTPWGLLRMGDVPQQSLEVFLKKVKESLNCEGLRFVDSGNSVKKVAVGGGSCGSMMAQAANAGCDTFVTADIKYNQFWEAKDLGINLIDAGHFHTENPVCQYLAEQIQKAFPQVEVLLSSQHTDCMKFFL